MSDNNSLDQVQCFLLDMDGTFYLGERLIEALYTSSMFYINKVVISCSSQTTHPKTASNMQKKSIGSD